MRDCTGACAVDQENTWQYFIQSIMFTSSIAFGLNQPLPERGVRLDVAAWLQRIRGFKGKKASRKLSFAEQGNEIEQFAGFGIFLEPKTLRERQRVVVEKWRFKSLLSFCWKICVRLTPRFDWWSPVLLLTSFIALERHTMCYNPVSSYKPNQAHNRKIIVSATVWSYLWIPARKMKLNVLYIQWAMQGPTPDLVYLKWKLFCIQL